MTENNYEGEVLNINGEEYSIFIEYDEKNHMWKGESYLDDEKIVRKSNKNKSDLIKKIRSAICLSLEISEIVKEDELGDLIDNKNNDDALKLINKIDPLSPTSPLWENDSGYPSFMGFAIQKNLPFLVNEMFKQININKKSELINREFFGLCVFNSRDEMWETFLNNVETLKVTKKYTSESALDVLISKNYYDRLKQILPKIDDKEKVIVKKAINKKYDHEYFKNVPLSLQMQGIHYEEK